MALIPQFYTASNKAIAEKSLELGVLKYPALCYIKDEEILAWVTKDGSLTYISGDEQITDISFKDQILSFYSNDKEIFSENISLPENVIEDAKKQILEQINIKDYIKTSELTKVLDNMVGDLKGASNLVEYIDGIKYGDLADIPIENLNGTLINAILLSDLSDGVYKVNGSYIIGGEFVTVQNTNGTFFIVSHDENNTYITALRGNKIDKYIINNNGSSDHTEYITDKWIKDNDFIKSSDAKKYIEEIINNNLTTVVKQEVQEQLFIALDENLKDYIEYIDNRDIVELFNEH